MSSRDIYSHSVFINCPFSSDYQPLFHAILFAIFFCGFRPRCALEVNDSSQNRLSKIEAIIEQCRMGIHDISFMKLDSKTNLPRFNMPFEFGIFLAAKRFGNAKQKRKIALTLDTKPYRYRAALSDISGQDIYAHNRSEKSAIALIRDWLDSSRPRSETSLPGGEHIYRQYRKFRRGIPRASREQNLNPDKLTYADSCRAIEGWLEANPATANLKSFP